MTTLDPIIDLSASVTVLANPHARRLLTLDLNHAQSAFFMVFTIETGFFTEFFGPYCERSPCTILADHRARPALTVLVARFPLLSAATWPANRYHHSKCLVFPDLTVSWIGSHNLTRSSYYLGHNLATRIFSQHIAHSLRARCLLFFNRATLITHAP